jgi:hypothetical protein
VRFTAPKFESVDPYKDAMAEKVSLRTGSVTWPEMAAGHGQDRDGRRVVRSIGQCGLLIAAGQTEGSVSCGAPIAGGANIRVDLTTVGTTYPGSDLSVFLYV